MSGSGPIIPDDFDLDAARNAYSTTDPDTQERCPDPDCESIKIRKKHRSIENREYPEPYYCETCEMHFDNPLPPKSRGGE